MIRAEHCNAVHIAISLACLEFQLLRHLHNCIRLNGNKPTVFVHIKNLVKSQPNTRYLPNQSWQR